MKTEMKTLYVYAHVSDHQSPEVRMTSEETMSHLCYSDMINAPLTTIEVAIPVIDESEVMAVLSGKKLESLMSQRKEANEKLMRIDDEIAKLKALEFKPGE